MATALGYGHGGPGLGSQGTNRAAAAAAAHSVQAHRVYVGNLPYAVGWRELKDFMREAGEVSFAEVLVGPDGRSKGCGVVEFSTGEGAQKAITELSDRPLLGRPVFIREDRETQPRYGHQPQRVAQSLHSNAGYGHGGGGAGRQLFISGLPLTVTWRTLKDTFRSAGNVLRADVIPGKGTGTILMSTDAEANSAIMTFNGSTIEGSRILVREDRYTQNQDQSGGFQNQYSGRWGGDNNLQTALRPAAAEPSQPSTQVFVNNLPYSTDSTALLALSPRAINAEVITFGGRSKGMGILEFPTLEASAEALGSLQGHLMGGRPIMVKYNERWHEFSDQAAAPSPM